MVSIVFKSGQTGSKLYKYMILPCIYFKLLPEENHNFRVVPGPQEKRSGRKCGIYQSYPGYFYDVY